MEKEQQPSQQIMKLQRSVRMFASNYLADNMFTLPALPSKEQYLKLLKQKEIERQRLKAEKTSIMRSSTVNSQSKPFAKTKGTEFVNIDELNKDFVDNLPNEDVSSHEASSSTGFFRSGTSKFKSWKKESRPVFQAVSISKTKQSGWGPVQVSLDHSSDPVVQQMANIKGYIEQAKHEKRWEEMYMFEQNLKELELIYLGSKRT